MRSAREEEDGADGARIGEGSFAGRVEESTAFPARRGSSTESAKAERNSAPRRRDYPTLMPRKPTVAMVSIPMLLTRRGWLGWAARTPYFLSLFLHLRRRRRRPNQPHPPPDPPDPLRIAPTTPKPPSRTLRQNPPPRSLLLILSLRG